MRRVALKVAYDGTRFSGSQRQPDVRTVEGDLIAALKRIGAMEDPREARFRAAGRTDAGVSAAGNVFAFNTPFRVDALPRAVTAHLSDAWAWGAVEVPDTFHPRSARRRTYRYFLPAAGVDADKLRDALDLFVGTHDFSVFCRRVPGVDTVRRVDRIAVEPDGVLLAVTVQGPSFLWNQIRRMVEAARRVACGLLEAEAVARALASPSGEDFGVAPPEPLVLLDVAYAFPFEADATAAFHAARRLKGRLLLRETRNAVERTFLHAMGVDA